MAFPETGQYNAHRGMAFFEKDHNDRSTMPVFMRQLKTLSSTVKVIFLEYYPEGSSPFLKFEDGIHSDLKSFKKDYTPTGSNSPKKMTAQYQVFQLWAMAYYFGIEVQGLEQPVPEDVGTNQFRYLSWRIGRALNEAFLSAVDRYAEQKHVQSVNFCLYCGLGHAAALKKLAPALPFYGVEGGRIAAL